MIAVLIIFVSLVAWALALSINRRRVRRFDGSGDPAKGIIVFVEPVRWLFIVWGFSWFCRGLRRAGCDQSVRLFRWGSRSGALLVLPDLMRRGRLDRRAGRLARFLDQLAAEHPGTAISLVGYSSGAYVALQACKQVACPQQIARVLLLAGSASPSYAWDDLPARLPAVHSFHSPLDIINIIGPLLFGSNDRKWGPGCGAVGFRSAPPNLIQRSWQPADLLLGYLGDHFTITSPAFIAAQVAPVLLAENCEL